MPLTAHSPQDNQPDQPLHNLLQILNRETARPEIVYRHVGAQIKHEGYVVVHRLDFERAVLVSGAVHRPFRYLLYRQTAF